MSILKIMIRVVVPERWNIGRKLNGLDFSPEASERPENMEAANVVHPEALIMPCHFCLEL